jgi:hypothetical protein
MSEKFVLASAIIAPLQFSSSSFLLLWHVLARRLLYYRNMALNKLKVIILPHAIDYDTKSVRLSPPYMYRYDPTSPSSSSSHSRFSLMTTNVLRASEREKMREERGDEMRERERVNIFIVHWFVSGVSAACVVRLFLTTFLRRHERVALPLAQPHHKRAIVRSLGIVVALARENVHTQHNWQHRIECPSDFFTTFSVVKLFTKLASNRMKCSGKYSLWPSVDRKLVLWQSEVDLVATGSVLFSSA